MMSGSTENLLRNSHLSASKESIDGDGDGAYPSQTKTGKERKTGGMENRGFIGDHREFGASTSSEIYETPSYHKRATSFQQKPMPSPTKEPRRHSSPDHSAHFHQGRTRSRQGGGRHRLSSNSEEDLRRKACLNSMKKHQSANPLPLSQEDEIVLYRPSAQDTERQSNIEDKEKMPKFEGRKLQGSSKHDTGNQQKPLHRQEDNKIQEVQNMQKTIIALEKSQLEQYKRRLTLALSERAKLTGELKLLSQNLTQRSLESDHHSRESIHLGSSHERNALPMASSRLSYSLGDLSIPEMYGDCDISVDYENNLRLPTLPTSTQSGRTKMEIPELDLASLNSSIERISSDHTVKDVEKLDDGKIVKEHYEDTKPSHEGAEDNMDQGRKEDLKKMVDDIWQDNLRGDVLAEDRQDSASENHKISENNGPGDSDLNNNELNNKEKRLTVEDFLADDDLKNQQNKKDKIQQKDEINVSLGYEDMNGGTSRARTPELYEPVELLLGQESYTQAARTQERQPRTPTNHSEGLLRKKDDEKSGKQDDLEEYFTDSTLPVTRKESMQDQRVRDSKRDNELNREQTPNENHQILMTRLCRNERRFDYMTPPGTRPTNAAASSGINYNEYSGEKGKEMTFEGQIPPSNISDKLQYYREKLANRVEEETSRDLADAYANEKDPEKRREIQQQAASEAAMLRREASALLWEAMNLERICDPNGRVRHVYLPH